MIPEEEALRWERCYKHQYLYCSVHQTLTAWTNTKETKQNALGERWWWKAPKCIWQGVNIELKDKQGECSSLFMSLERQRNMIAGKTTCFICPVCSATACPVRQAGDTGSRLIHTVILLLNHRQQVRMCLYIISHYSFFCFTQNIHTLTLTFLWWDHRT